MRDYSEYSEVSGDNEKSHVMRTMYAIYCLPFRVAATIDIRNYSAGGSKGPARPLGGVRGKEAWGASRDRLSPSPRRLRRRKRKET